MISLKDYKYLQCEKLNLELKLKLINNIIRL